MPLHAHETRNFLKHVPWRCICSLLKYLQPGNGFRIPLDATPLKIILWYHCVHSKCFFQLLLLVQKWPQKSWKKPGKWETPTHMKNHGTERSQSDWNGKPHQPTWPGWDTMVSPSKSGRGKKSSCKGLPSKESIFYSPTKHVLGATASGKKILWLVGIKVGYSPSQLTPENTPLEKENHLYLQTTIFGFHVRFLGCFQFQTFLIASVSDSGFFKKPPVRWKKIWSASVWHQKVCNLRRGSGFVMDTFSWIGLLLGGVWEWWWWWWWGCKSGRVSIRFCDTYLFVFELNSIYSSLCIVWCGRIVHWSNFKTRGILCYSGNSCPVSSFFSNPWQALRALGMKQVVIW